MIFVSPRVQLNRVSRPSSRVMQCTGGCGGNDYIGHSMNNGTKSPSVAVGGAVVVVRRLPRRIVLFSQKWREMEGELNN